jgi:hypothetical protein
MSGKNTQQTASKTWTLVQDTDYAGVNGLAELWKAIVSPAVGQDFSDEELQTAYAMLSEIAKPQTEVKSYQQTATAKSLQDVVESFKAEVANSSGKTFKEIRQQAENWYDQVEKMLKGLVYRIQNDKSGAFIGGDPAMLMRRTIGLGGMMAITSPSVPVKQNVLMTIIGAIASENALKEVYEEYKTEKGLSNLTFRDFVEELVQPTNYTWFRKFLDKVEYAVFGREGVTAFKVTGKEETVATPPPVTEKGIPVTSTLNLGKETIKVETQSMMFSNLLKGVLLYVDALATPELSDDTPIAKWTWNDFNRFYNNTLTAIKEAKNNPELEPEVGQQLEKLGKAFIDREKTLRYGEKPSKTSKAVETSPIGSGSPFGNAVRDFYVAHFGGEATKVKSFGISLLFNTIADKLGIGSSILPSVVYDVWMNANVHNLLREAESGFNDTGLPNADRLKALEQKYREALLPYGFDVEMGYDEKNKLQIAVKDYKTGNVFQRKTTPTGKNRGVEIIPMTDTDKKIADTFKNAPDNTVWAQIRKEWEDRRMFLASEATQATSDKAQRLTNLTRVFLRRGGREEWHSVFMAGEETAGETLLKQLEKAVNHYMSVAYDTTTGEVRLLPNNPAYQAIMQMVGNNETLKQQLLNENGEMPIQNIANSNNTALWNKYKQHINELRAGGLPSVFSEHVLKNALYNVKSKPMSIRALQALLWVCTRKAL